MAGRHRGDEKGAPWVRLETSLVENPAWYVYPHCCLRQITADGDVTCARHGRCEAKFDH